MLLLLRLPASRNRLSAARARGGTWSLSVLVLAVAGCAPTPVADLRPPGPYEPSSGDTLGLSSAFGLEAGVARVAAAYPGGGLWPGFDPLAVPLAVYDGERTVLFRHPSPPAGFRPVPDAPGAVVLDGRHEEVVANTSTEIGGVLTATVMLGGSGVPVAAPAAVAVHEAFHVYQYGRHPGWRANEADLFVYPTDDPGALALRRLETAALRRALEAGDDAGAACWSRAALALRAERYTGLDSASVRYERTTELNEGLAAYVEARAAGRTAVALPEAEFGPADVRLRAYATGTAFAVLLDRTDAGWKAGFDAGDDPLDVALGRALGPGETCAFGRAETDAAARASHEDVAALQARRASHAADFEARPGWRVVVEVPDHVMWVEGFDPLNVERVDATRVLHRRMLRLANQRGRLRAIDSDAVDVEALTEGVGRHPLFTGVARVAVSVEDEPVVYES